jgi:hypothetical protein
MYLTTPQLMNQLTGFCELWSKYHNVTVPYIRETSMVVTLTFYAGITTVP